GVNLVRMMIPENFPRTEEISVDVRVFCFTLVVSLLTGIIFGLIPALQMARTNLNETLKEGGRSSGGNSRNRPGGLLVVSEVALALLLLAGAGVMVCSLVPLMRGGSGLASPNVLPGLLDLARNQN